MCMRNFNIINHLASFPGISIVQFVCLFFDNIKSIKKSPGPNFACCRTFLHKVIKNWTGKKATYNQCFCSNLRI